MTVAEVLRAAAERLRTHGWCQGSYKKENGTCCARGALVVAIESWPEYETGTYLKTLAALASQIGNPALGIEGWNDAPGRTAEEVIAALEAAAANAEEERAQ